MIELVYNKNVESLKKLYEEYSDNMKLLIEELHHHYGEHRVDVQSYLSKEIEEVASCITLLNFNDISYGRYRIMIYFPTITVTNENNLSTEIKDVYIILNVDLNGILQGPFALTRGSYTEAEARSEYVHSHCSRLRSFHNINGIKVGKCCLGSGPIGSTITSLYQEFDIDIWKLFFMELQVYLQTESIKGGPYIKLGIIKNTQLERNVVNYEGCLYRVALDKYLNNFVQYFCEKRLSSQLKFKYKDGFIKFGESMSSLVLIFSKLLLEYMITQYKNESEPREFLKSNELFNYFYLGAYNGENFYRIDNSVSSVLPDLSDYNFVFKNKLIEVTITNKKDPEEPETLYYFINENALFSILNKLIVLLNLPYGKDNITASFKGVFIN